MDNYENYKNYQMKDILSRLQHSTRDYDTYIASYMKSDNEELGADKIRVNTVNPDAVISDSNIWSGGWAEGRAKAYGITVAELPAYYAKRTLFGDG